MGVDLGFSTASTLELSGPRQRVRLNDLLCVNRIEARMLRTVATYMIPCRFVCDKNVIFNFSAL